MTDFTKLDLAAVHLHRALDGSWYVVASVRDTQGGRRSRIIRERLPDKTMEKIVCLIETDEPFRRDPVTGKILLTIDPDISAAFASPRRRKRRQEES